MTIKDKSALDRHRGSGPCLACGRWAKVRHAHHAFLKRGVGGGSRLDVDPNLAALDWECHHRAEHSTAFNATVQEKVAQRERRAHGAGATVESILSWLHEVLRADKAGPIPPAPWETGRATKAVRRGSRGRNAAAPDPQGRPPGRDDAVLRHPVVGSSEHPWTGF